MTPREAEVFKALVAARLEVGAAPGLAARHTGNPVWMERAEWDRAVLVEAFRRMARDRDMPDRVIDALVEAVRLPTRRPNGLPDTREPHGLFTVRPGAPHAGELVRFWMWAMDERAGVRS